MAVNWISLKEMRFEAHHGVYEIEKKEGNEFIIDLDIKTDFFSASESDQLKDTLDYAEMYEICKHEMDQRSDLLEHVALRIRDKLCSRYGDRILKIDLSVSKMNPPLGGPVGRSMVRIVEKF